MLMNEEIATVHSSKQDLQEERILQRFLSLTLESAGVWASCCHKHLLGAEPFFLSNISGFFFFFLFLPQPPCVQFKLAVEWQSSPLDLKLAGTSVSTTYNARGGGGCPPSFPK